MIKILKVISLFILSMLLNGCAANKAWYATHNKNPFYIPNNYRYKLDNIHIDGDVFYIIDDRRAINKKGVITVLKY